jgi:hypothetical protein
MKKILIVLSIIGFLYSCSNDDSENETQEFISGEVSVGIKSGTDIADLFNFISQFELEVDNVNSLSFTSNLPSDNLQSVLDNLNQKNYTNDGVNWFVTGYLHYQTSQIWIFPRLFDMNNMDYQQDWLTSMVELELNDVHNVDLNSGIIRFKVPEGQELLWKNQFENYDIVDWAELNYIADIEPNTN